MPAVLDSPVNAPDETALITQHVPILTRTTLFELIAALQDAAGPDDDATVVAAVVDMSQTGRIRLFDEAVTYY